MLDSLQRSATVLAALDPRQWKTVQRVASAEMAPGNEMTSS